MAMEPEQEYAEIRALLHATAERDKQTEARMNRWEKSWEKRAAESDRRMARIEKRAAESEKRAEQRAAEAEKRMDRFDKQLLATKKLVDAGIKIVVDLGKRQKELEKSQKLFMDWLRRGNGNGRRHI